jgi:hypothetical protein
VFVDGKLKGQEHVNAVVPGHLLHLTDDISHRRYLVNTGVAYSLFPHSSSAGATGPSLCGPSGSPIHCWGEKRIQLSFRGQRFSWNFLLAEVDFPILGVDFLRHHRLAVDAATGQLVSTDTMMRLSTSLAEAVGELAYILSLTPPSYCLLFSEFPDVVNPSRTFSRPKHGVEHHIITSGRPVTSRFQRLDTGKLEAAKKEFEQMEADGIIRLSSNCWASPLHMVRKSDRSWRPCGDYRRLNLVTRLDQYLVPNMMDLAACLHECKVFIKLDLKKGYYQIPVWLEDVQKTAVINFYRRFIPAAARILLPLTSALAGGKKAKLE